MSSNIEENGHKPMDTGTISQQAQQVDGSHDPPVASADSDGEKDGRTKEAVDQIVEKSKTAAAQLSESAKQPTTGAAIFGATIAGAAVIFGVGEAAVAGAAAYAVYRAMKNKGSTRSSE